MCHMLAHIGACMHVLAPLCPPPPPLMEQPGFCCPAYLQAAYVCGLKVGWLSEGLMCSHVQPYLARLRDCRVIVVAPELHGMCGLNFGAPAHL